MVLRGAALLALLVSLLVTGRADAPPRAAGAVAAVPAGGLGVRGPVLVDATGRPVQLRGVNLSGAQYVCLSGRGTWDVPATRHTIADMEAWGVDAVRIPLNEDCWLGGAGLPRGRPARAYRADVTRFVRALAHAGMRAIVDLHYGASGRQDRMADRPRAPAFWRSVARTLRGDPNVLFDLYNEPHGISWRCWRDGCGRYAGMSGLVTAVRRAGARQPVIAAGLDYGNDLSGWLAHRPHDPLGRLLAGFHNYGDLHCRDVACFAATVAPVAARVPVVTTETGEFDCSHAYLDTWLPWADAHGISYLAWAWNAASCRGEPSLLDADGNPSPYGAGYRAHLLLRAAAAAG